MSHVLAQSIVRKTIFLAVVVSLLVHQSNLFGRHAAYAAPVPGTTVSGNARLGFRRPVRPFLHRHPVSSRKFRFPPRPNCSPQVRRSAMLRHSS